MLKNNYLPQGKRHKNQFFFEAYYQYVTKLVLTLGVSKIWYQGMLTAMISGVFEDLKFNISEGSDQN